MLAAVASRIFLDPTALFRTFLPNIVLPKSKLYWLCKLVFVKDIISIKPPRSKIKIPEEIKAGLFHKLHPSSFTYRLN
jgi:hypothetical protein